ncbi:odorant receptor 4 [Amyelois transitella]|uniref:odorant receptor 4 n=1 Tax=Amyelois transitella TaxID=680683 RepID=UPI00067A8258|nr:odorant receptor 4 [Amyelois transitella]
MSLPRFEDLFKQIKTNFWLFGIPYDQPKIHIRFFILIIGLLLMVTEEILFLASKISTEDLLVITQLAPCCCIGVLSLLKVVCLVPKRNKIFSLTHSLKVLYIDSIKEMEKREIIRDNINFVSLLSKYFFLLNAVLISVYNFSTPLFILYDYIKTNEIVFRLPYDVIVPFRVDRWSTWSVVYIHSISSGFICVLFFTTIDILYCILTSHICNNFALISNDLLKINCENVNNLKNIIKQHQHIMQLSQELEDIFSLPNLFNVLVGSVEICALGFNLTMGSLTQVPGCVLFLISVLLQILMMSVFGENLIRESKNVGDAVYFSDWHKLDVKTRKIILIIITRAHRPQILTAYKFSTISYQSFTKIISSSWTYFTILKTVYKPPENTST